MRRLRVFLGAAPALILAAALSLSAAEPPSPPSDPTAPPRLIIIKVDGLSPILIDALMDPDNPEKVNRLPDPEGFHRAVALFRLQTGSRDLVPNLRRYFYQQGVVAENMYSSTTTLSAIAWSVIETGQPSVIKRHMYFNRANGQLRGYLDAFRDTWDIAWRRGRKTTAVWELDQTGVSLFADAFQPLRRYDTPQMYYRLTPASYLGGMAGAYLTAGESNPWGIVRRHLARQVEGMNYPDFSEEFAADHIAAKLLELDTVRGERYDYISTFFSLDHQQHVDPDAENLIHRMIRMDRRIGRIFNAVEQSQRREVTLVALVSDHGSEYEPGAINQAWPITRAFRTRLFGGHTVATVMAEDAGRALSSPVPGIDYPRIYESPFSPYGKAAGGEDGYSTTFIDNFGNARAEVHLRNNDLNRLQLLLQARQQRRLDEAQRARLGGLLRSTLADTWRWLEADLAGYEDYYLGADAWLPNLKARPDYYWRDVATRFEEEQRLDAAQLRALRRLAELCRAPDPLAWLEKNKPPISDLIPKRYFGRRNSVYQLTHYTIGLDEQLDWVESTLDLQGERVPMDYISILSNYSLPNPPTGQVPNPVDLIVRTLPVESVPAALLARGWLPAEVELQQAIWIVSTAQNNLRRGDQALLLEAANGDLRYLSIHRLRQRADGQLELEPAADLDPLGLLYDEGFQAPDGTPAFWWLGEFHGPREWLAAVHNTHYTVAPLIFDDIAGLHTEPFVDNPEFQQVLAGFPSDADRQRYLRGLRWKYRAQLPDLLLWSNHLWNFSSKSQTSGGSHGGVIEEVTRTTFMLWGGREFHLPAGERLSRPATTMDIAPTLAELLGMLDSENRVVRQAGAIRERPFLPFAGRPLLEAAALARFKSAGTGAR